MPVGPRRPPSRRTLDASRARFYGARMATREDLRIARARLAAEDPELLAAVDDVDMTLIDSWLRMAPWERVAMSLDSAAGIEELKTWRRVD